MIIILLSFVKRNVRIYSRVKRPSQVSRALDVFKSSVKPKDIRYTTIEAGSGVCLAVLASHVF